MCTDEDERALFADRIVALADDPERAVVVVGLRGDYYDRCAAYPALAALLAANQVLVGPMALDELRRAVELPARRAGVRVESALVERIVSELGHEAGGLPLLSTALVELWFAQTDGWLRLETHESLGGVRGAVARLAESSFEQLSRRPAGGRAAPVPQARADRRGGHARAAAGAADRARSRTRPRARHRRRDAHSRSAADRARRRRRGRPRGRPPRMAAPAELALRGRPGPRAPRASHRERPPLGGAEPGRGRSLPRRAPVGHARLGFDASARAQRARAGVPRREQRRERARADEAAADEPPAQGAARRRRRAARALDRGRRDRPRLAVGCPARGDRRARPPARCGGRLRAADRPGDAARARVAPARPLSADRGDAARDPPPEPGAHRHVHRARERAPAGGPRLTRRAARSPSSRTTTSCTCSTRGRTSSSGRCRLPTSTTTTSRARPISSPAEPARCRICSSARRDTWFASSGSASSGRTTSRRRPSRSSSPRTAAGQSCSGPSRIPTDASGQAYAEVWSIRHGGQSRLVPLHAKDILAATATRDGRLVVVDDGEITTWNTATMRRISTVPGPRLSSLDARGAISPDGRTLRLRPSGRNRPLLRRCERPDDRPARGPTRAEVDSLAFSPDSRLVVSTGDDRTVIVWNARTGELVERLDGPRRQCGLRGLRRRRQDALLGQPRRNRPAMGSRRRAGASAIRSGSGRR